MAEVMIYKGFKNAVSECSSGVSLKKPGLNGSGALSHGWGRPGSKHRLQTDCSSFSVSMYTTVSRGHKDKYKAEVEKQSKKLVKKETITESAGQQP